MRARSLSVRGKLFLLSVIPVLVTSVLLLVLFMWGHEAVARAYERAHAWERHAHALRILERAARFHIDTVADRLVVAEMPWPHEEESRLALDQARAQALSLASHFSAEEQASQARLDDDLGAFVAEAERVTVGDGVELSALVATYQDIDTGIERRLEEEERGSAHAIRAAHELSDTVHLGGLAVGLMAFATVVAAVAVAVHRFGGRVAALERTAARVASGDLDRDFPVTSGDELGRLGRSLTTMVESLRRQRTQQLGFLASVAHDLRNPLAAMRLSTEGLLKAADLPPAPMLQRSLALVHRQIERLARLADDLLDAASIEAGELQLKPRSCDLVAVARDVIEIYAATAPKHELRLAAPAETVVAVCDPTRIAQVLDNLVNNAIKYSPAGGTVEVRLEAAPDEVMVSVSDHGVGMQPELLATIFEPFRRLSPTADVLPGVGLGLAICRRIVAAHGGRIEVESEPGRGTRFQVHLPRQPGRVGSRLGSAE